MQWNVFIYGVWWLQIDEYIQHILQVVFAVNLWASQTIREKEEWKFFLVILLVQQQASSMTFWNLQGNPCDEQQQHNSQRNHTQQHNHKVRSAPINTSKPVGIFTYTHSIWLWIVCLNVLRLPEWSRRTEQCAALSPRLCCGLVCACVLNCVCTWYN